MDGEDDWRGKGSERDGERDRGGRERWVGDTRDRAAVELRGWFRRADDRLCVGESNEWEDGLDAEEEIKEEDGTENALRTLLKLDCECKSAEADGDKDELDLPDCDKEVGDEGGGEVERGGDVRGVGGVLVHAPPVSQPRHRRHGIKSVKIINKFE